MLRVGYGSRKMTNTPEGKTPTQHVRCGVVHRLFDKRKTPLDRAAISSIRASNPFEPLPSAFTGPYIELRAIYLYNLPPEILSQQ